MQDTEFIETRLRDACTLPEVLAAGFDAFEVIRRAARGCVDTAPGLFAAFMTTAREAVEGREAITVAPSLPPGPAAILASLPTTAGVDEVMSTLASLGALAAGCLSRAAATASVDADRVACEEAASAAQRIRRLMARDDDAAGLR